MFGTENQLLILEFSFLNKALEAGASRQRLRPQFDTTKFKTCSDVRRGGAVTTAAAAES